MGTLNTRIRGGEQRQSTQQQGINNQSHDAFVRDNDAYRIWLNSDKTIQDFVTYANRQTDHNVLLERVGIWISSLVSRQKLLIHLDNLQKLILGINESSSSLKLSASVASKILQQVHQKLANIWFIWPALASNHYSAASLHQQILPQLNQQSFGTKLQTLYQITAGLPSLSMVNSNSDGSAGLVIDLESIVKSAIRTNFPFIITKQTISSFFKYIIEIQVVIEDVNHFSRFISAVLDTLGTQKGLQQCKDYTQRLHQMLPTRVQNSLKSDLQIYQSTNSIYKIFLQESITFLQWGYPHAADLLFQAIERSTYTLTTAEISYVLTAKIYSLFIYDFKQLNLEYRHMQKMPLSNIIHLILKNNDAKLLNKLKDVYVAVGGLRKSGLGRGKSGIMLGEDIKNNERERNRSRSRSSSGSRIGIKKSSMNDQKVSINEHLTGEEAFQLQLENYIFSSYCGLQTALSLILQQKLLPIASSCQERQTRLVNKINEAKFDLIIENQNQIKKIVQVHLEQNPIFDCLRAKIEEVLELVRLLLLLGVNEKFGFVTVFYCAIAERQHEEEKQYLDLLKQQRALHIFKTLISKFYTSTDRNLKLSLSSPPTQIDLSKPQSIFQLCEYLFSSPLSSSLHSLSQLHQIIFQHMIYFYKYDEIKSIINSTTTMNKYNINTQIVQTIVVGSILDSLRKSSDIRKSINDVNMKIKLLKKSTSIDAQGVKAFVTLVTQLIEQGVQLTTEEKNRVGVDLLYGIVDRYPDRIQVVNFDTIYEHIRTIRSNELLDPQQKFMMTNQLLQFKCYLAEKAYKAEKRNLGNELIDQISRFNPPWLTTKLIKIFKNSSVKIDNRIYGIAMKACFKGEDLQYLMKLWRQQKGREKRKQKGFADLRQYFQTGRKYLVIDETFIIAQDAYRNYVADSKFNDQMLNNSKYDMFFVLIGTEPERAFHYALKVQLDPAKVETFLREAMKNNIINCYTCTKYLLKYFYFAWRMQKQKLQSSQLISYSQYCKLCFAQESLSTDMQVLQRQSQPRSPISEFYNRILSAYMCSAIISEQFLNTYFSPSSSDTQKANLTFQVLYNQSKRKSLLIQLRQQPMGRSDIFKLDEVCRKVLAVNFLDLCIFNLANIVNTSETLSQKCENIMQKIITLSTDKVQLCKSIIGKLIQKVFSVKKLYEILAFMQSRENANLKYLIKQRHMAIIEALAMVEMNQQLHGLIPNTFFDTQIGPRPLQPLSASHEKSIQSCWSKTNIFVISKVMFFIYGMNHEIEDKIWSKYLAQHPDQQLQGVKEKLAEQNQQ